MRMHHCALCAGETLIRPCPELCSTVVTSCLQPLGELHGPWKRFTGETRYYEVKVLVKSCVRLIFSSIRTDWCAADYSCEVKTAI